MSDTLTDIHAAVGEQLAATEEPLLDDDALDAELDAKAGTPSDADLAEPEPDPAPVSEEVAASAAPAQEEADPLANAKPFEYTVDGQAKVYEGIRVLADKDGVVQGAIITPESFKDVQYRLQRGEYLEGQNKALYEKARDVDAITFTDRATNTEHKGFAAVEQYALENARQHAALTLLSETIETPDKLIALAIAVQNGDNTELNRLTREIGLVAKEATWKARESWGQRITQVKEQESTTQDRAAVTSAAIAGAVGHWAKQFPTLTAEDQQKAVAYFTKIGSAIVRPATPDEAKTAGVKPGELVVDHPVLFEYLSDRAALRKEATASTTAASTAAKENAARLAQAARGKTKAPNPTKGKRPVPAEPEGETWAQQRSRLMAGEFSTADE